MKAWFYDTMQDQRVRCRLCSHMCVYRQRQARHLRGAGKSGWHFGDPGIRAPDRCRRRSHRKKTNFSSDARQPVLFHRHGGLQLQMQLLPERRHRPDAGGQGRDGNGGPGTPEQVVSAARRRNCASIAYTYTEPTVFFEFACDTAELAHRQGIKNVFVTNGYMSAEALDRVSPWLDAANVDLKAYTDDFYKQQCGARLEPVKKILQRLKALNIWVEVTTLIIPGLNDDPGELSGWQPSSPNRWAPKPPGMSAASTPLIG